MRLIAETAIFAAGVLAGLRHFGVTTEITELDRYVGILLTSIYTVLGV